MRLSLLESYNDFRNKENNFKNKKNILCINLFIIDASEHL